MDTVEIVVYLAIAMIVGGLVLVAVGRFSGEKTFDAVKGVFSSKKTPEFAKIDENALVPLLYATWQECGLGTASKNVTFQYTGPTSADKAFIFAKVKAQQLCVSLSSLSQNCGKSEDLVLTASLNPGQVYMATCDPDTRTLRIS